MIFPRIEKIEPLNNSILIYATFLQPRGMEDQDQVISKQNSKKFITLSNKKKAGILSKARLPVTIFLPIKRKRTKKFDGTRRAPALLLIMTLAYLRLRF
jgi:hypothetical protein